MKKLLVASLVLMGGLGVCSTAPAVITLSKHDFTKTGWADGQICLPCHAPHNNQNSQNEVLWNHDDPTKGFTLYWSPTMKVTAPGAVLPPSGVSKFCLSCHDGVTAMDAYGGSLTASHVMGATSTANLGTDLSNDHPVSVVWDTADTGLVALATVQGYASIPLFGVDKNIVECASCHDVHNKLGKTHLVNEEMAGSLLCLKCHAK